LRARIFSCSEFVPVQNRKISLDYGGPGRAGGGVGGGAGLVGDGGGSGSGARATAAVGWFDKDETR
jgi:hypothetical protein